MSAADLLARLSAAGLEVTADGAALAVRPASKLTDELRAELRASKPELLALLAAPAAPEPAPSAYSPGPEPDARVTCLSCRHYRPGRCDNHRRARLSAPDVGRDLAGLLQHCPGFEGTP